MYRLARVADNVVPPEVTIEKAIALGREVVRSANDRSSIIESEQTIDVRFALPTANWDASTGDYINAYRLLASLKWDEIRHLRLRSQNFSGNSLITQSSAEGQRAADPIPPNFELKWDQERLAARTQHWHALTRNLESDLILRFPNVLGETGWWIAGGRVWRRQILINVDVVDYQERINLINRAGLIAPFRNRRIRILEIGGGYGALAFALTRILDPSQYVICDLPESLLFSGLYLSIAQDANVRVASPREGVTPARPGEIYLLPNYLAQKLLPGQHFDLVINTLSMSEMSVHQVETYAALISDLIGKSGAFFEQNHDNTAVGLINCHDHLRPFFAQEAKVDPLDMPTTRGDAIVWSNRG